MKKYNLDTLVSVGIYDYMISYLYEYIPEHKHLWYTIKEHIVFEPTGTDIGMEVPKNHKLIDGIVYEKPNVILNYANNTSRAYHFDSMDDAEKFYNKITDGGRWI